MKQRTPKELDAIDARLRVLIDTLPPKASPTRNPEHAKIVYAFIALKFGIEEISNHPEAVSNFAMALLDLPEIIG